MRHSHPAQVTSFCFLLLAALFSSCEEPAPRCYLEAFPNPVERCSPGPAASTEIGWFCEAPVVGVEVRIGGADGELFAEGGPYGYQQTGDWLHNETVLVLRDKKNGKVLATTRVEVETRSCEERE